MSAVEKIDAIIDRLDELHAELPEYNSASLRIEVGTIGAKFRGLAAALSRKMSVPKQFAVPQKDYWGKPVENEASLPPVDFIESGATAVSIDGPTLWTKSDEWKEL